MTLRPWVPKTEVYRAPDGSTHERPDYWSRPYPATPKMMAAIVAGLERPYRTERDPR